MLPPQFMPPGAKKAPAKALKMGVPTKTARKPAKKPAKKGC